MNVGPAEILVVLAVALIVFGPKRLPEIGRQVGAALRELRRVQDTVKAELESVINPDAPPSQTVSAAAPGSGSGGSVSGAEEPDHSSMPPMPPPDPDEGFRGPASFS